MHFHPNAYWTVLVNSSCEEEPMKKIEEQRKTQDMFQRTRENRVGKDLDMLNTRVVKKNSWETEPRKTSLSL